MKKEYIVPELKKVEIDTKDIMSESDGRIVAVTDEANYDQAPSYKISSGFWLE